jgi:hypothetical protein
MTVQEIIAKCEENYDSALGYHCSDEEGYCYYLNRGIDPQYANSPGETVPTLLRSTTFEAFYHERPGMIKDYWDFSQKRWRPCSF